MVQFSFRELFLLIECTGALHWSFWIRFSDFTYCFIHKFILFHFSFRFHFRFRSFLRSGLCMPIFKYLSLCTFTSLYKWEMCSFLFGANFNACKIVIQTEKRKKNKKRKWKTKEKNNIELLWYTQFMYCNSVLLFRTPEKHPF